MKEPTKNILLSTMLLCVTFVVILKMAFNHNSRIAIITATKEIELAKITTRRDIIIDSVRRSDFLEWEAEHPLK